MIRYIAIFSAVYSSLFAQETIDIIQLKDWSRIKPANIPKAIFPAQYQSQSKIRHITFHHTHTPTGDGTKKSEIIILNDQVLSSHCFQYEKKIIWSSKKKKFVSQWYKLEKEGKVLGKWGGVAYHYLIGNSGTIYKGRPDSVQPASGTFYYPRDLVGNKYADNEAAIRGAIVPSKEALEFYQRKKASNYQNWLESNDLKKWKKEQIVILEGQRITDKKDQEKELKKRLNKLKASLVAPGDSDGHITISFIGYDKRPSEEALAAAAKLASNLLENHGLNPTDIKGFIEKYQHLPAAQAVGFMIG